MTDFPNALPKGHRLHEYEIVRVLGVGGFGVTYLAYDHHLDTAVAIKEYLPNDLAVRMDGLSVNPKSSSDRDDFQWGLDRFMDEARTLARFDHPSIIRVMRFFETNDTAYIVMEYAEGETLAAHLRDHGPLDEDELKTILLPLLDGLEQVHQADLLHRDIKPDNIILRADGSPVLIDFGAARLAVTGRSRSLSAVLSPGYAPIEQYSTRGKQGPWTDIYALSAVAYVALTGHKPIEAPERVRDDPLQPAVEAAAGRASSAFLTGVDAGLTVFEDERPRTLSAWRDWLTGQREDGPEVVSSPHSVKALGRGAPPPTRTGGDSGVAASGNGNGSRYPRLMWPGVALMLVITIALVWTLRPESGPEPEPAPIPVQHELVAEIQDYLNRLGYHVPEDGEEDTRTMESIRDFEESQGLVVTGKADEVVIEALRREYRRRDQAAWSEAESADTEAAYSSYLNDFPQGEYIAEVEQRIEQAHQAHQARLAAEEERRREEAAATERRRQLISAIQVELRRLGHRVGTDGVYDDITKQLISEFQDNTEKNATGQPSQELLSQLEGYTKWPTSQSGSLAITSFPKGAQVILNGDVVGTTDVIVNELETGSHELVVQMDGYEEQSKVIGLDDGQVREEHFVLMKKNSDLVRRLTEDRYWCCASDGQRLCLMPTGFNLGDPCKCGEYIGRVCK